MEVEMRSSHVSSDDAGATAPARSMRTNLEVVVIPVSDVDRAKEFYAKLG